ncbi:type II secretion system F family protein [Microbacterium nymphoidis]|uniref:type II secretion system F family protein n=1 Tax=Microbacterium nymphoidis TaxID=2898586 RepID=UPI001E4EC716|nr:type II secretion system F family protein [Microbacterium nymphoidis]MCD2499015.1 type II secretion system F family protein [Microbacterium nymphoidis]
MRRAERYRAEERRAVAETAQRLAVLLRAGIAPERAWHFIAEVDGGPAASIVARMGSGQRIADAVEQEGGPWRSIAGAWRIAAEVGAPLADSLRSIAGAARDAAEAADDVAIALAEPAMTARIMTWLPAAGLLLGAALGFDVVGVVLGTPVGAASVIAGAGMMLLGRWWSARLIRSASRRAETPGLRAEFTAIALSGGASASRASALVEDADPGGDPGTTARVLELSRVAGVPAAELLRAAAADERQGARTHGRIAAAQLGSRLLLPLGVCTLPAFFLLGVAPMILSVLATTPVVW